jgi:hypothetical protein
MGMQNALSNGGLAFTSIFRSLASFENNCPIRNQPPGASPRFPEPDACAFRLVRQSSLERCSLLRLLGYGLSVREVLEEAVHFALERFF